MPKSRVKRPVIKWSGSKRKIAPFISDLLPSGECYYEPFVGSGALLPFHDCEKGIAGDIIPELIELWREIRDQPDKTANEYEKRWKRLQDEGHEAYYDIRESFNQERGPFDFLFLSRTCVNGLIRFNSDGNFNNSLHHGRPGIAPSRLRRIILEWSHAIRNIEFTAQDYRETLSTASSGDVIFLDPPYGGTKGRYLPDPFDMEAFFAELERLNNVGAKWVLTLDGKAGDRKYNTQPPADLFQAKLGLPTGNAPFRKLTKTSVEQVVESVYLNFEPGESILNDIREYRNDKLGGRSNSEVKNGTLF